MKAIIFIRRDNIMKKLWKRNAVVGAVLALVVVAVVLNGRYAENVVEAEDAGRILGQATEVLAGDAGTEDAPAETAEPEATDYFAAARLSRRQARDSALALLQEASASEELDEQGASEVAQSIEALASYTLSEAQIENMITAKGYDDCVVFLSDGGASVVVSTTTDGLQTEDVARITDVVKQETGLAASAIKILEVN